MDLFNKNEIFMLSKILNGLIKNAKFENVIWITFFPKKCIFNIGNFIWADADGLIKMDQPIGYKNTSGIALETFSQV